MTVIVMRRLQEVGVAYIIVMQGVPGATGRGVEGDASAKSGQPARPGAERCSEGKSAALPV